MGILSFSISIYLVPHSFFFFLNLYTKKKKKAKKKNLSSTMIHFNIPPPIALNYDYDSDDETPQQHSTTKVKFPIEDEDLDFERMSIANRAFRHTESDFRSDETISDPAHFYDWVLRENPLLYTDSDLMHYHLAFYAPTGVLIHFKSKEVKNKNSVVQVNSRLISKLRRMVNMKTGVDPLSVEGVKKVADLQKHITEGLQVIGVTVLKDNGRFKQHMQYDDRGEFPGWEQASCCLQSSLGHIRVMNNPNPYLPLYIGEICKLCHFTGTSNSAMGAHYDQTHTGASLNKENSYEKGCYQYYGRSQNVEHRVAVYMEQHIINRMAYQDEDTRVFERIPAGNGEDGIRYDPLSQDYEFCVPFLARINTADIIKHVTRTRSRNYDKTFSFLRDVLVTQYAVEGARCYENFLNKYGGSKSSVVLKLFDLTNSSNQESTNFKMVMLTSYQTIFNYSRDMTEALLVLIVNYNSQLPSTSQLGWLERQLGNNDSQFKIKFNGRYQGPMKRLLRILKHVVEKNWDYKDVRIKEQEAGFYIKHSGDLESKEEFSRRYHRFKRESAEAFLAISEILFLVLTVSRDEIPQKTYTSSEYESGIYELPISAMYLFKMSESDGVGGAKLKKMKARVAAIAPLNHFLRFAAIHWWNVGDGQGFDKKLYTGEAHRHLLDTAVAGDGVFQELEFAYRRVVGDVFRVLHFPTKKALFLHRDGPSASNGIFDTATRASTFVMKQGTMMKKLVLGMNFFHTTETRLRNEITELFNEIITVGNRTYDFKRQFLSPYKTETSKDMSNFNTSLLTVPGHPMFGGSFLSRSTPVGSYYYFLKERCSQKVIDRKVDQIVRLNLLMMLYIAMTNNSVRAAELGKMTITKDVLSGARTPCSLYNIEEERALRVVIAVVSHKSLELKNTMLPRFIFNKEVNRIATCMFGPLRMAALEFSKSLRRRRNHLFLVIDDRVIPRNMVQAGCLPINYRQLRSLIINTVKAISSEDVAASRELQAHVEVQDGVALSAGHSLRTRALNYDTSTVESLFRSEPFKLIQSVHHVFYKEIIKPCEPVENEGILQEIADEVAVDFLDSDIEQDAEYEDTEMADIAGMSDSNGRSNGDDENSDSGCCTDDGNSYEYGSADDDTLSSEVGTSMFDEEAEEVSEVTSDDDVEAEQLTSDDEVESVVEVKLERDTFNTLRRARIRVRNPIEDFEVVDLTLDDDEPEVAKRTKRLRRR
jgi:hypothetical protein